MDAKQRIETIYESVEGLSELELNHLIVTLVEMTKKRREARMKELVSEHAELERANVDLHNTIGIIQSVEAHG